MTAPALETLQSQLATMLSLQDSMNTKVHPDWRNQGFEWYRAVWIEAGELMDHQGYKWWKKQTPDVEQVHLEIVDIWHFGLSLLLERSDQSTEQLANELASQILAHVPAQDSVLLATEALASYALSQKALSIIAFVDLLNAAGMSLETLYTAYVGKNVLNFFRQDNGYKEGTYIKQWQGREDNEHLVELSQSLDTSATDYPDQLYQALQSRYTSLTQTA